MIEKERQVFLKTNTVTKDNADRKAPDLLTASLTYFNDVIQPNNDDDGSMEAPLPKSPTPSPSPPAPSQQPIPAPKPLGISPLLPHIRYYTIFSSQCIDGFQEPHMVSLTRFCFHREHATYMVSRTYVRQRTGWKRRDTEGQHSILSRRD